MASRLDTVLFICDQAGLGARLSYRKMFGEFALYLDGKVIGFVCDDQFFLKPTPEGRACLGVPVEAPPYPGAKNYFLLTDGLEDRVQLRRVLEITACALPEPRPKPAGRKPMKAARTRGH